MSDAPTIKPPVLRVTRYDVIFSVLVAAFIAFAVLCFVITSVWLTNRQPPKVMATPVEMVEMPGGFEDGFVNETLRVDAPGPEVHAANPDAEVISDQLEMAGNIDATVGSAEGTGGGGSDLASPQFETGIRNIGQKGSSKGTGRRGLGFGPGKSGFPREQRWFIRFSDRVELTQYAKELDFFKIELAALLPDRRLAYISNISAATPTVRYAAGGKDESRMYMTWQGGERKFADVQLFAKAGIDVPGDAPIFHFYPPPVEAQLAQLERDYRGRPISEIKRTYFNVEPMAGGYRFIVTRQLYHTP
jgi:hypothetical protein